MRPLARRSMTNRQRLRRGQVVLMPRRQKEAWLRTSLNEVRDLEGVRLPTWRNV